MAGTIDVTGQQYYTLGIGHARIPQRESAPSTSFVLSQSAVPVILAPSGTVATNGTITLGTALATTYANAWVYLPAGAVVGGLAGLYYTMFSSTTVGVVSTLFADTATAFTPFIPTNTTNAVGSNSAYTQVLTLVILANINIPGGLLGVNGAIRTFGLQTYPNNANGKSVSTRFSSAVATSATGTTTAQLVLQTTIRNRGIASQIANTTGASSAVNPSFMTVNTATDQPLTFGASLTVATDFSVLEGYTVEVLPGSA